MRGRTNALEKLVWAQNELRRVRGQITPDVAPQVARRIRALLKSVDGAIRNAERFSPATHTKVLHGQCAVCGHFGQDCTGGNR